MFSNKSAEDIVALLEEKNQPEAVIVGGMATVTEFLSSGLVDESYLVYEPVLFGDGLPLFKNPEVELKLSLISVDKLNNSINKSHYKILEQ
jgi:dihydrofolate reductase